MSFKHRLRRRWVMLKAYFYPDWRELECSKCYVQLRARSGPHMTHAVGRHNDEYHPGWRDEVRKKMAELSSHELQRYTLELCRKLESHGEGLD